MWGPIPPLVGINRGRVSRSVEKGWQVEGNPSLDRGMGQELIHVEVGTTEIERTLFIFHLDLISGFACVNHGYA